MPSENWTSCTPEDGVERFTERSDDRKQLFEDAATRLSTTRLSPLIWAFLQICDLERLRMITANEVSWMSVVDEDVIATYESIARNAIRLWQQRGAQPPSNDGTPASSNKQSSTAAFPEDSRSLSSKGPSRSPAAPSRTRPGRSLEGAEHSVKRSQQIAGLCKERDHGRCVVSKLGDIDACHIYPLCAFGNKEPMRVGLLWRTLKMFWPEDKVDSWYDKIFRDRRTSIPRGTETVENMLSLCSSLHRFHTEAAFALRPVRMSDDKSKLELEFHWLARQQRDSRARMNLMEQPVSSRDRRYSRSGVGFHCYEDMDNPTCLVSGTKFTMSTDDPATKPLPDPGLLEMQWHLQRIVAMSGAAGWREEDYNDDPGAGVEALPSVELLEQWLDGQPDDLDQSRCSSPGESVEVVDGPYE